MVGGGVVRQGVRAVAAAAMRVVRVERRVWRDEPLRGGGDHAERRGRVLAVGWQSRGRSRPGWDSGNWRRSHSTSKSRGADKR